MKRSEIILFFLHEFSNWADSITVITGGSRLSRIFGEHENLSDLSIIQLIQLL